MAKKKSTTKSAPKHEQFILWNPDSQRPPQKMFNDRSEAERVAILCAPKYNGTVYVAKLVFKATPPRTVTTVITNEVPALHTRLD